MSVFSKTLLWFIGTVLVTMAAIVMLAAVTGDEQEERRPMLRSLLDAELLQAREIYLLGGPVALDAFVGHLRRMLGAEVAVTDPNGVDLVTGNDRSDLIRAAGGRGPMPVFRLPRRIIMRVDPDSGMRLFLLIPRAAWFRWFFEPRHLLFVFALIALLCYVFARNLTKPVRQLQKVVEGFGRGELDQRAELNRSDEMGELGRTFNQMADRIQTLLAAERRLLGDISHELRSPLARLSVAVELARTSEDPAPQLDRIQKEADRLNSLVGELLQVTRAEGDPSQMRKDPVDLRELTAEVVEDARVEAGARGCGVALLSQGGATIQGDEELLRRAIENVVRNAVRFEPEGSDVQVTVEGPVVTVRDHGPGVPGESLNRIFDAFYRVETDRGRASGGVGLGLSIAKRAVALHEGRIVAENTNPGLIVRIELPT